MIRVKWVVVSSSEPLKASIHTRKCSMCHCSLFTDHYPHRHEYYISNIDMLNLKQSLNLGSQLSKFLAACADFKV